MMNYYGKNDIPFLFIIDFEIKNPLIIPIADINDDKILFNIDGVKNYKAEIAYMNASGRINLIKKPISYERYLEKFNHVIENEKAGNSYLVNLTYPTEIEINLSFEEIFFFSNSKYKLFYKDRFVLFSPETFIKINGRTISSYPMKGTIDSSVPDAYNAIIKDEKEFSEHLTIVDLIRNDLNMIAKDITVKKFQYIDYIKTHAKDLLQVSSEISGTLDDGYHKNIGEIIAKLLPAGSITGAPKKKTVEIIKQAEGYERGYYTGIFGYYNNRALDSAVMIRFMEKQGEKIVFKSGGGITVYSDPEKEYKELLDKVYVPIA